MGSHPAPRYSRVARKAAALAAAATLAFTTAVAHADEIGATEWPLDGEHFNAQQVWTHSRGTGVTVAVLDTGVEATHPDLAGQILPGTGFAGIASDTGQSDFSRDSHGTSIAAIIAGTGHGTASGKMIGLAPGSKILPVRVAIGDGVEPISLAQAIVYSVDHHARIINISQGTTVPDPQIRGAITYALAHDTVVVAAAGNSGRQANLPIYPAAFPGVISVTGVDRGGQPWSGSESGGTTTVAAPAVDIYSAANDGKYLTGDGTSYSAPYVSATAALIWSQRPELSAGQVIRQLVNTADPHGARPHDDHYGYGVVDPLRAVTSPPAAATSNPLLQPTAPPASSGSSSLSVAVVIGVVIVVCVAAATIGYRFRRRRRTSSAPHSAESRQGNHARRQRDRSIPAVRGRQPSRGKR